MCVAGLNVSTRPCAHRWYELRRSCHPANNLANCPERLQIEGWEQRNQTCPWCDNEGGRTVHDSTHKLFGSSSSASSTVSSPTSPHTRSHRSGSDGTLESLSRVSSFGSVESDSGQRHRNMHERLEIYLRSHPHELLPSAKKNYPTYPGATSTSPTGEHTATDEFPLIRRTSSGLSRHWKKGVRLSKDIFRT